MRHAAGWGISSWEGLWATFEGCHRSLDGLADWTFVFRLAAWADILGVLGADEGRSHEVAQRYIDAQRRGHPPIQSAIASAGMIGTTMPMGVLTNGPPDIQRLKLSQTGLEVATDAVVIFGRRGIRGARSDCVFGGSRQAGCASR